MSSAVMQCPNCKRTIHTGDTYKQAVIGDAKSIQWLENNRATFCQDCQNAKVVIEGAVQPPIVRLPHK